MSNVTVVGADNTVLTLSMDGVTNYQLAQQFAALVNGAAAAGTLSVAALAPGFGMPAVPAGSLGEAVLALPLSAVTVPGGYTTLLDIAAGPTTIFAGLAPAPVSILAGVGGTTFNAGAARIMFAAGGGNNVFNGYVSADGATTPPGAGSANLDMVATGPGNDTISTGTGNFDVDPGTGQNVVTLGAGINYVNSTGQDLIYGGPAQAVAGMTGSNTIYLSGNGATVIGGARPLDIFSGTASTVSGSTASNPSAGGYAQVTLGSGGGSIAGGFDSTYTLAGAASVNAGGNDTVNVAGATALVQADTAPGGGSLLVNGPTGAGTLEFIGGTGSATLAGGALAVTVAGADGGTVTFTGAASGNMFLVATAAGADAALIDASAATGANTFVTGVTGAAQATSTVLGGTGADLFLIGNAASSLTGGAGGANTFDFVASATGGATDVITDFKPADRLGISGYAANGAAVLANATVSGGTTTITLSDQTRIVLQNYTTLTPGNFS